MGTDRELQGALSFMEEQKMMPPAGSLIIAAVSGGGDSMALLHFLAALGRRRHFTVAAAHFNHQLRPTAGRDEAFVRTWAQSKEIPFYSGTLDVDAYRRQAGLSPEEGARQARYAFLERLCREHGAWAVATGHHRRDQAETVLLNLTRGAGLAGLRGIAPRTGSFIRPLLTTSQEELRAYCSAWSIPCMEDETNSDVQIPRNRIRHQVLPALAEINPQAESVLARTAAIVAEEHAFLEAEVTRRLPSLVSLPEGAAIPYADYRALDTALRPRAIRRLLDQLGSGRKDVTAAQLHAAAAIRPGQALTLPGGIWLSVYDDHLRAERLGPPPPPVELPLEGTVDWGPWRLTCHLTKEPVCPGESALLFSREALTAPLLAASWQRGGRLRLANGSRSLKRLLTDAGVPPSRRHLVPVLYSGTTPIGVFFTTATVCPPAAGEEAWVVTAKKR